MLVCHIVLVRNIMTAHKEGVFQVMSIIAVKKDTSVRRTFLIGLVAIALAMFVLLQRARVVIDLRQMEDLVCQIAPVRNITIAIKEDV